jgi:hypothetical protein
MLPEGLDVCPSCGKRLKKKEDSEYSSGDIAWISSYVLAIILIPLILIIVIGIICVLVVQ